jgi:hypothetical protein
MRCGLRSTRHSAVHDLHRLLVSRQPVEVHVKNFRDFSGSTVLAACLAFTGSAVAWGEPTTESPPLDRASYVEDPLAPHETTGTTARLGTSVGFIYGEPVEATALGVTVAGGKRWGRFGIEAEYTLLQLSERGPSDLVIGDAQRLGVIARFEAIRLGSHIVGPNSMFAVYVEGGAGVAWNDFYRPGADETGTRIVADDSKRAEGQIGFGIMLDHRLQEPIGFPRRIGWFLGWRMTMTPHEDTPMSICRGVSCRAIQMEPEANDRFVDRSMLFQSSLSVTW